MSNDKRENQITQMEHKNQAGMKWNVYLLCIIPAIIILMFDVASVAICNKIAELYQLSAFNIAVLSHALTIVVWGTGGVLILMLMKRKLGFDLMQSQPSPTKRGLILSVVCVVVMTAFMCMVSGGVKPVIEFQSAMRRLGSLGWIDFVLQNIYYVLEMFIALIICALGQEVGELLTKRKKVPWSGIALGISWGLLHILTQDIAVGLAAVVIGLILGLPYILLIKNAKLAWLFMFLMFVL